MQQGIEYTAYDGASGLSLAAKIYNITSGTAVLDSTVSMAHVINGTYAGVFDADDDKTYLVNTMVYTDGTFVTASTSYSAGSKVIPKRHKILKRATAYTAFIFPMYDSDGVLATGLTITATVSLDGAAFGACTNSPSEVGSGLYKINLSTADTDAAGLALKFLASGARTSIVSIFTEL